MRNAILENVLRPVAARCGTVAAAWLIARGYDAGFVEPFIDALGVAGGLGFDLVLSRYFRKLAMRSFDVRH